MTDFSWQSKEQGVWSWPKCEHWIILWKNEVVDDFTFCLNPFPIFYNLQTSEERRKAMAIEVGVWNLCWQLYQTKEWSGFIFNLCLNIFTDILWGKGIPNWCKCEETETTSVKVWNNISQSIKSLMISFFLKFSTYYRHVGREKRNRQQLMWAINIVIH